MKLAGAVCLLTHVAAAGQVVAGGNVAPAFDANAPRLLATRRPATEEAKKLLAPGVTLEPKALEKANLRVVPLDGATALVDESLVGDEFVQARGAQMLALAEAFSKSQGKAKFGDLSEGSADALRKGIAAVDPGIANAMRDPSFEFAVVPLYQASFRGPAGTISVSVSPLHSPAVEALTRPDVDSLSDPNAQPVEGPVPPGRLDEMHLAFQASGWSRPKRAHAAHLLTEWLDQETAKLDEAFRKSMDAFRMALWNAYRDKLGDVPPSEGQAFAELDPRLRKSLEMGMWSATPKGLSGQPDALQGCALVAARVSPQIVYRTGRTHVSVIGIDLINW